METERSMGPSEPISFDITNSWLHIPPISVFLNGLILNLGPMVHAKRENMATLVSNSASTNWGLEYAQLNTAQQQCEVGSCTRQQKCEVWFGDALGGWP